MKVEASAPGKLVLLGEYAVLEGAPALVMAVDRRAVAEVERVAGTACEVFAPDVYPDRVAFDCDAAGEIAWPDPAAANALALVTNVVGALGGLGFLPAPPWRLRLDSSAFFDRSDGVPAKLGLGSSAAMTVALASALAAFAGHADVVADRARWLRALLEMHRGFQSGHGSGLDVAAAVHGGVIRYRVGADRDPQVSALRWPEGLHRLCVWSGRSASTTQFLRTLDRWRIAAPDAFRKRFERLAEVSNAGAVAVAAGDAAALSSALAAMGRELRALGDESKITIYSHEHERISEVVEGAGGVYKPCGAGGGDVGLAVAAEIADAMRVRSALDGAGIAVLPLGVDAAGLVVESFGE